MNILLNIHHAWLQHVWAKTVSAFLTCRTHVAPIGYLLQGYIMGMKGLWWVKLLLGVNHTRELGLRAHCHSSTLPLGTKRMMWFSQRKENTVKLKHLCSTVILLLKIFAVVWFISRSAVEEQFSTSHSCETRRQMYVSPSSTFSNKHLKVKLAKATFDKYNDPYTNEKDMYV